MSGLVPLVFMTFVPCILYYLLFLKICKHVEIKNNQNAQLRPPAGNEAARCTVSHQNKRHLDAKRTRPGLISVWFDFIKLFVHFAFIVLFRVEM